MYELTHDERKSLFEGITKLLEEYDYEYSNEAINKIIDTWATNKQALIEALKNHPNYVKGKFLIAFESNYEREIDVGAIKAFARWINEARCTQECFDNLPEEMKRDTHPGNYAPYSVRNFVRYYLPTMRARTISAQDADEINNTFPTIKAREGEKTSRVVNKIFTYLNFHKIPCYNREYAKYADALTPITIKRHTIISVNPIDYLTMSFGNSWASCHTIDKQNKRGMPNTYEGQYSSGTMSYMLDTPSLVFYTVDAKYDGTDFFRQDKIQRQMYHFSEDKLIQGRLYPQSNDGADEIYTQYRAVVQQVISDAFGFPNLWIKKRASIYDYVYSEGTHYCDYEHFSSCTLSFKKDVENDKRMTIGHAPICIECGNTHDVSENINCCRSRRPVCCDCGCILDEDDAYEIDGEYYCPDCVAYCNECGEYHPRDNTRYVPRFGTVCDSCFDYHFILCDDCRCYVHESDIQCEEVNGVEVNICERCLDEYYWCEECERYFSKDKMHIENGEYLCNECYAERHANENTEEDE